MRSTHLILVRHGQTQHQEREGAYLDGWADLDLSPTGRQQAEALARRFTDATDIAALYSSPLKRARQTAELLLPSAAGSLRLEKDLREINCGEVEGVPVSQVQASHPKVWDANLRRDDPDFRWPGGESYHELRKRSLEAIIRIASRHAGQRVLVVTHCGLITQILGAIHGISAARWDQFRPGTASVTEIHWFGNRGEVLSFDDRSHLVDVNPVLDAASH